MPDSQLPESRQEKLKSRLFRYARSMVQIRAPHLAEGDPSRAAGSDYEPGEASDEDHQGDHQLLHLQHLKREWKELREVVLPGTDKRTDMIGPDDINKEGIDYLESIVDTLDRLAEKLEEERSNLVDQKRSWAEAHESDTEDSGESSYLSAVQSLERSLEETEEQLSLVYFRRSLAEAILTQIALLDTVLTWEEFHPRPRSEQMGTHEKRTVVVGLILNHILEERGYLPDTEYDSYKDFFSAVSDIGGEHLRCQGPAVNTSLRETGCWITGKEGVKASHLRQIMVNAIRYAKSKTWRPKKLRSLKKRASDTL